MLQTYGLTNNIDASSWVKKQSVSFKAKFLELPGHTGSLLVQLERMDAEETVWLERGRYTLAAEAWDWDTNAEQQPT